MNEASNLIEETADMKRDGARTSLSMHKLIRRFQEAITKPDQAPFPVIAAVHGPVFGLGVDIISSCDIRYAAENSIFAIKVCSYILSQLPPFLSDMLTREC